MIDDIWKMCWSARLGRISGGLLNGLSSWQQHGKACDGDSGGGI